MNFKNCSFEQSMVPAIRLEPIKGLDEHWINRPMPAEPAPSFNPRRQLQPLNATLLAIGMAKTMAGR